MGTRFWLGAKAIMNYALKLIFASKTALAFFPKVSAVCSYQAVLCVLTLKHRAQFGKIYRAPAPFPLKL